MTSNDLERALGRLEGKMDLLLQHIQSDNARAEEAALRVSTRMRGIERQHWMIMGGLTLIMILTNLFFHIAR